MSFSSFYNRTFWKNRPNTSTALGATNLNKIESAIVTLDTRTVELDTSKLDLSVGNEMVKSVTFTKNTGTLTVMLLDGTVVNYDTAVEKIATNFQYDAEAQMLILTLVDGTTQTVDLSALITQYEFIDSDTIAFSINEAGKVSALIKNGSVTEEKLQPNFLSDVRIEAGKAQAASNSALEYAENAAYDAKLSQSYAVGTNGEVRENDATDNAKYYKEACEDALSKFQAGQVTSVNGEAGDVLITAESIDALTTDGDTSENTVTFTSDDDSSPSAWTDVTKLTSGEKHNSIFNKVSKMFKNVRYIWKLLGSTDISKIGNGTITGAVSTLNNNLTNKYQSKISY